MLTLTLMGEMFADSDFIFYQIFVKLAGNEDSHKILDALDFWPDQTIRFGVNENFSHRLIMEKMLSGG